VCAWHFIFYTKEVEGMAEIFRNQAEVMSFFTVNALLLGDVSISLIFSEADVGEQIAVGSIKSFFLLNHFVWYLKRHKEIAHMAVASSVAFSVSRAISSVPYIMLEADQTLPYQIALTIVAALIAAYSIEKRTNNRFEGRCVTAAIVNLVALVALMTTTLLNFFVVSGYILLESHSNSLEPNHTRAIPCQPFSTNVTRVVDYYESGSTWSQSVIFLIMGLLLPCFWEPIKETQGCDVLVFARVTVMLTLMEMLTADVLFKQNYCPLQADVFALTGSALFLGHQALQRERALDSTLRQNQQP
jgi:hypothetical protein